MAREWSLQETKALVEEHIALKEEEKPEVRTASEHWNKVAKRLRDKGFNRSHKSCNKRWYRLEQYEVQIFSFNMEEGKHRNYWDLTRAERLEYRDKWPQLPSGDGIDMEIFESLKRFSQQYEKEAPEKTTESASVTSVVDKEVIRAEPSVDFTRKSAPPVAAPVTSPVSASAPLSHPVVNGTTTTGTELKREDESMDCEKQAKSTWPASSEKQQQPLSSQEALDGFKVQARVLRRRRAAELRRINRTVPYNTTHTTFMKANQSSSQLNTQNSPPISSKTSSFGSVKAIPPPDLTNKTENATTNVAKDNLIPTKLPIKFKRVNPPPNFHNNNNNNTGPLPQQQPIGSHLNLNFQVQNSSNSKTGQQLGESTYGKNHGIEIQGDGGGHLPLLQSINSHLPLLQPKDSHMSHQQNAAAEVHHSPLNGDKLPPELLQLGSLEEQLQVILGVRHGPLHAPQKCEQQLHKNQNQAPAQLRRNMHERQENMQGSAKASLLGAAIGGLEAQLGALVKLLQAKHAAEQEFREKMLLFVECMVVSLHTIAQANARTSG